MTSFVGDSFVHGACVPSDSNFQGNFIKLGRLALGFGIGGNGPMMYLSAIKEYGKLFQPKNIMFMYYEGNDIPQIRAEKNSPLMKYLDFDHQVNLAEHQQDIDNRLRAEIATNHTKLDDFQQVLQRVFTLEEISKRYTSLRFPQKILCEWDYEEYQLTGELEVLTRTVKEAARYSKEINSNFFSLYLGSINSLINECHYAKKEIISALENASVKVIDTTPIFRNPSPRYELFSLGRRGGGTIVNKDILKLHNLLRDITECGV